MRAPRTIATIAVASVIGGAAGAGIAVQAQGDHAHTTTTTVAAAAPAAQTSTRALSAREIYKRASGSVAYVTAASGQGTATGTGFVISADGLIVTNQHVIAGARTIKVKVGDGATRSATLVGQDASTDLALLRVPTGGRKLTPLNFGDSSKVQIGDATFAIGNPFGLDRTLTTGVVSATQRQIDAPDGFSISGAIQTDAALNPGNSGGPLLDAYGDVIGVNSQIETGSSQTGSSEGSNTGIGFAIPSNTVRKVVAALEEGGKVSHAYLGVSTSDAAAGGATVRSVSAGGPAARAGLKAGQTIVRLGSMTIGSSDDLAAAVDAHKPGDRVKVAVRSGGRTTTVQVALGDRPASAGAGG